jgi:antitoxin (DNA-binding transcriptional repressor) of toxin-antitoxin stability system
MRISGVYEAKQSFSEWVALVEAGEEVRMLPVTAVPAATPEPIERELELLRKLRSRVKPGPGWKALRDEGRRA